MGHFESCLLVHFLLRYKASKYGVSLILIIFTPYLPHCSAHISSTSKLKNMIQSVPCLKLIPLHPVDILSSEKISKKSCSCVEGIIMVFLKQMTISVIQATNFCIDNLWHLQPRLWLIACTPKGSTLHSHSLSNGLRQTFIRPCHF